ncbi:type I DNA topoisomerase [Candidatus Azambacteria bacterium]|nr:type I DNA topoisomerase [Candidatus Azambacteria bacterium]
MKLIIVESPTKAKTISKFLGKEFEVESSYGHVRDLPEKTLGVDIEHNFEPKYVIVPKAKKRVAELNAAAKKSTEVILATDEDREGEAIAWHLVQALGLEKPKSKTEKRKIERIVFHEITESAIKKALENPRGIDAKLVGAQQARRVLDRLVGYKLSPFLRKKVAKGLSAGRVQSVAVRLVTDREKEIQNFNPEEYWTITANLEKLKVPASAKASAGEQSSNFEAQLAKIGENKLEKFSIKNKEEADKIFSDLSGSDWRVLKIEKKETKRQPLAPFTTSTLQQTAWAWHGFGAKQTMVLAQQLYETGLITYMRTDSVNLSKDSIAAAYQKIKKDFGENYLPAAPRVYKTKSKTAQEAHEAIRPTSPEKNPETLKEKLDPRQHKLYDLIWRRFIASQMASAVFEATGVDVLAEKSGGNYTFRATGNTLKFDGFLKVYSQKLTEILLPALEEKEPLNLKKLLPAQHFTEPPPRYNEASLIKALEENGIGRPSTYAPTLATIQARNYVIKDEQKRLKPTEVGTLVNDILVEHFPEIVELKFTARMEENLDEIAEGKKEWQPVVKEFWVPFKENLDKKTMEISKEKIAVEKTELKCPECGKDLLIRMGRFGKFYACSGFPDCRYTAPLKKSSDGETAEREDFGPCPKCETGKIVRKRTRKGRFFWGCSTWPKCDYATWENPKKDE